MLKVAAGIIILLLVFLSLRAPKRPGIALGLVWCIYAMEQVLQAGFSIFISRSYLLNVAVFGVTCVAALSLALRTKLFAGFRFPKEALWALLLFILLVVSIMWAPNPYNSAQRLKDVAPYLFQFAVVAPLCVMDKKQLDHAINVLLYFGFFVLAGLALTNISNRAIVIDGDLKGNPLAIAGFSGTVILAAVFKIYGTSKKRGGLFLFHVAIVALGLLVLTRSGSRGQVVASVIAMVIWLPVTARVAANRSSIIAIGGVLVFCVGLYYFVSNGDDVGRWRSEQLEANTVGRLENASRLLTFWFNAGPAYWLFGLGTSAAWDTIDGYPHVVPLEVLAEEGVIGFFLFFVFFLSTTLSGLRVLQSKAVDVTSRVNLGMVLAMFTFHFALCFKQGSLIGSSTLFGFGLTAAFYMAYLRKEARKNKSRYPYPMHYYNPSGPKFVHPSQVRR